MHRKQHYNPRSEAGQNVPLDHEYPSRSATSGQRKATIGGSSRPSTSTRRAQLGSTSARTARAGGSEKNATRVKSVTTKRTRTAHPQSQERAKDRSTKQLDKRAIIIAGAAVVVVGLCIIGAALLFGNTQESDLLAGTDFESTPTEIIYEEEEQEPEPTAEELAFEAYKVFYFYEESRSSRYLAYHQSYPELSDEQVVWRVNVDLDLTAYEAATEVADPEALDALVSKHFVLPSAYEPQDMVSFGSQLIRADVAAPLEQLIVDAQAAGVSLSVSSGYRSFALQDSLYWGYVGSVGYDLAEMQSAHGGHSEHQTGRAIDFGPTGYDFYNTPQQYWLEENAWRYGFIVRYQTGIEDITLYLHEPWHIRYVGLDISTTMYENGIRSFEEYWVKYVQHTPPEES